MPMSSFCVRVCQNHPVQPMAQALTATSVLGPCNQARSTWVYPRSSAILRLYRFWKSPLAPLLWLSVRFRDFALSCAKSLWDTHTHVVRLSSNENKITGTSRRSQTHDRSERHTTQTYITAERLHSGPPDIAETFSQPQAARGLSCAAGGYPEGPSAASQQKSTNKIVPHANVL